MASYAEIFKQQKNGVFKVKEIDVSEELPEIGKMYVKELNGFTKLSIIQSRQTDTEKMCLLICMSLCDKDGNSTESPDTFGDVISMMPDRVFNKVLQATLEVNNAQCQQEHGSPPRPQQEWVPCQVFWSRIPREAPRRGTQATRALRLLHVLQEDAQRPLL